MADKCSGFKLHIRSASNIEILLDIMALQINIDLESLFRRFQFLLTNFCVRHLLDRYLKEEDVFPCQR